MQQARVRTESMAQRLSKKPLSEGFELWDKGYYLGAMRLFIFKAETSPPFQLGACLDAMGHLLMRLDEGPDASENFGFAAEKYELIQQPVLAKLMKIKALDAESGPEAALGEINTLIKEHDAEGAADKFEDVKVKTALARSYHFRGELLLAMDPEKNAEAALKDAEFAAVIGWDRDHVAHFLVGSIRQQMGDELGAIASYEKAIARNGNCIAAYESLAAALLASEGGKEKAIATLSKAIEMHPKSSLIRQKAFAMSESGNEVQALAMLDEYIKNPPHEETEALVAVSGAASATFLKAKAAIYADSGKMAEAQDAAEEAMKHNPSDEEAKQLLEDIKATAAQ
jgi:tetratricopeptide (TPR) repeat protein